MIRAFFLFPILLALASCSGGPFDAKQAPAWPAPTQLASGHIDFDWQLSGDRAVAPLQVFNDSGTTWLQFARGQSLPAIFAVVQGQESVVPYVWQAPYAVLAGRWPEIVLHGGRLTARARHGAQMVGAASPAPEPSAIATGVVALATSATSAASEVAAASKVAGASGGAGAPKVRYISALEAAGPVAPGALATTPLPTPGSSAPAAAASFSPASAERRPQSTPATTAVTFGAGPQDVNMRRALTRWARLAGWTFSPQHWVVDADIPLAGSADLGADFKLAVDRLLESTELSDRPAHPCFYSNRVLRVLPLGEPCVRASTAERSS